MFLNPPAAKVTWLARIALISQKGPKNPYTRPTAGSDSSDSSSAVSVWVSLFIAIYQERESFKKKLSELSEPAVGPSSRFFGLKSYPKGYPSQPEPHHPSPRWGWR